MTQQPTLREISRGNPWLSLGQITQLGLSQLLSGAQTAQYQSLADTFAAAQNVAPYSAEAQQRQTIESKNRANYELWLARFCRDPLADCEAH